MDETTKRRYDSVIRALSSTPSFNKALLDQLQASMKITAALGSLPDIDGMLKATTRMGTIYESLEAIKPDVTSPILDMVRCANLEIGKLSGSLGLTLVTEQMKGISPAWQDKLTSIGFPYVSMKQAQLGLQSHFSRLSSVSVMAEKALANLDLSRLGVNIGVNEELSKLLQSNVESLTRSYSSLFESFDPSNANVLNLHPIVSSLPPIEYYNEAVVAEVLTSDSPGLTDERAVADKSILDENSGALEQQLVVLEPEFVRLWKGAKAALISDNPDRVRHFTTSLRELHSQVIHKLAPDNEVMSWTRDPAHYDDKGRPTRAARLLYICRHINHGPFSDFVRDDMRSTLSLFKLFQKGTHEIKGDFTDAQLHAIQIRSECSLRFVIEIGTKASGT
jgi:hypothetical protein